MNRFPNCGTILFNARGSFARLGDFPGGDQEDQLPFALHCGERLTFPDPEVAGSGNTLVFTFTDVKKRLKVVSRVTYDPENAVLRRRDTVTVLAKKNLVLRRYLARFPLARGEYEVHGIRSFWCREDQGAWTPLHAGKLEFFSREGRWCEGSVPFAALRDLYGSHALGFLVFPEGDWLIRFSAVSKNGMFSDLTVEAGLSDDRLELELRSGESWEAPTVLIQLLPGKESFSGAARMDRYLNGLFPARPGHAPVVYNTWLDRDSRLDVSRLRKQLAAAKECGCEVFVVDYGWYEDHHAFTRLDNWTECADRAFFGKMKRFADEVRRAGLGFGFWVEFEFFSTESAVVKELPLGPPPHRLAQNLASGSGGHAGGNIGRSGPPLRCRLHQERHESLPGVRARPAEPLSARPRPGDGASEKTSAPRHL